MDQDLRRSETSDRSRMADRLEFLVWTAILVGLTSGYCLLIWYVMGMFRTALDISSLPRLSAILLHEGLSAPWQALHWHLLVGTSALIVLIARLRSGRDFLSTHIALLLGLSFWQGAAALMPFVAIAYSLD